jgi:hypothetical protein
MAQLEHGKVKVVLGKVRNFAASKARRVEELEELNGRIVQNILATMEIGTTAFGMGFLRGYYGEKAAILGLPIDAATGLLLHGVAYGLGFAGGKVARFAAQNIHNVANGALATWAAATGAELGLKKRPPVDPQSQQEPLPPSVPVSAGEVMAGALPQVVSAQPPQPQPHAALPMAQMPPWQNMWGMQANPWAMQANPWGPQPSPNALTHEELAAAASWNRAAA